MKRIIVISIVFVSFIATLFAEEPPSNIVTLKVECVKKFGGKLETGPNGGSVVRYDSVWTDVEISSFNADNTTVIVEKETLSCKGSGPNKCNHSRHSYLNKNIYRGFVINDDYIWKQRDELMDYIDNELVNKGIYSGTVSKKLMITNGNGYLVLLLTANWKNGNNRGDANIEIKLQDITNTVKL